MVWLVFGFDSQKSEISQAALISPPAASIFSFALAENSFMPSIISDFVTYLYYLKETE